MPPEDQNQQQRGNPPPAPPAVAPAPAAPAPAGMSEEDRNRLRSEAVTNERTRISEISALAARHNCSDLGQEHIKKGTTLPEFRGILLDKIGDTRGDGVKRLETPPSAIGMDKKDLQRYSLVRAIRCAAAHDWRDGTLELEASNEVAKRVGRPAQGFFIPLDAQEHVMEGGKRDVTLTTPTAGPGSNLKATNLLSGSFIDILRNRMLVRSLGARVLSGLVGDIAIPKQTAAGTAYWVTEGNAPTESAQQFGQVTMAPKTLGAFTDISRKMLLQSTPSIEMLVRDDLARVLALEMDRVAINGSGSGAEPTGILGMNGIGSVAMGTNGGAPTWASIVQLWREIAIDNADVDTMNFITNPKLVAKLMTTPRQSSGVEGNFIMNDRANLMGYGVGVTNQSPSNLTKGTGTALSSLLFGNFSDAMYGEWGVLDVLTDPYTGGTAGTLRVRLLMDTDFNVRRVVSFAAVKDYITT